MQELYAYGFANIVSSFFSCFVSAASLSRSLLQEQLCSTQVNFDIFHFFKIMLFFLFRLYDLRCVCYVMFIIYMDLDARLNNKFFCPISSLLLLTERSSIVIYSHPIYSAHRAILFIFDILKGFSHRIQYL